MAHKTEEKKITTGKFRVSFPHVFKPQTTDDGGQAYTIVMMIPKGDTDTINKLKALAKAAAYEKWGKDAVEGKKVKLKWPIRDGEEKADQYPEYEGMVFASATNKKNKPKIVDKDLNLIVDESEFYPGCYARASVKAYAWEWKTKKGVSFGLYNLQKVAEGEPFGSISKPEDDFEAIEGDNEDYEDAEDGMFG